MGITQFRSFFNVSYPVSHYIQPSNWHSRCFFEHPDRPDPSISSISMYFRYFKCLKPIFFQFVLFFSISAVPFTLHHPNPSEGCFTIPNPINFGVFCPFQQFTAFLCISIPPRTLTWKSISPVKSRWEEIHLSEVKKWWSQVLWTAKTSPNDS